MGDYIKEIRKLIGTRPFIMAGSAVLVFNEKNEILLQLRADTGNWGLPGGGMEPGESFEETAVRELYEETGLKAVRLRILDMLSGSEFYFKYPNGDEIYNAIALFLVEKWEGFPRVMDDESRDLRFFALNRLPELASKTTIILEKLDQYEILPEIKRFDIRVNAVEMLALQRAAYQVEADLIGTDNIPPLKETVGELAGSGETFIGYYIFGKLAGAVSYKAAAGQVDIHRVMVHPDHFRKGIAAHLIRWVEEAEAGAREMVVSTGADNTPAVALYKKLGFEPAGETIVGGGLRIAHFKKQNRQG
ncbi:GNAT family N-acetyltransferase [Bacillus sp. T33-2]|uniref:GNAT family N-acetyltransferase n=1 Tax=Bacillus sp. T33-2 TaxID=2054168 RepID=UPI0015E0CB26|nr:GNAT family N-acetyltransferase [Bacillus sp. T33-2]